MVPFEPEGPENQLSRVVRDDFIAHVAAGGTVASAFDHLRAAYPAALIGPHAHGHVVATLALTAWDIGRLSPFMASEAVRLLEALPPKPGTDHEMWTAQNQAFTARLKTKQPDPVPLRGFGAQAAFQPGAVVQMEAGTQQGDVFLLPLARHWIYGGFHALALGVHPSGTRLLQRSVSAPPFVFIVPERDETIRPRPDLRLPRRMLSNARRHILNIHARLIAPRDLRPTYASLLA